MLKLLSFTILWYILWRRNEDNLRVRDNNCTRYFNPRSPCGERLRCSFQLLQAFSISIHAPRAGSDKGSTLDAMPLFISIHAPRAGSDKGSTLDAMPLFISIHAPRAGSDALRSHSSFFGDVFQSTLPVRGATIIADYIKLCQAISIHAPRAGSDDIRGCTYGSFASFQSTLPVRGATAAFIIWVFLKSTFQSTLPVRGATSKTCADGRGRSFQSTLPVRGATDFFLMIFSLLVISIHAPRAGSDRIRRRDHPRFLHFNPRSPCGERLCPTCAWRLSLQFQSTLPVRGATAIYNSNYAQVKYITVNIAHPNFISQTPPLLTIALTRQITVRTS